MCVQRYHALRYILAIQRTFNISGQHSLSTSGHEVEAENGS